MKLIAVVIVAPVVNKAGGVATVAIILSITIQGTPLQLYNYSGFRPGKV
jgi:hypothetical protein